MNLEAGIKGRQECMVTDENTAESYGSGRLPVFATPAMIALMEKTALLSVAPFLQEGQSTVGTKVDVAHVAATPLGQKVTCTSELIAIDRRRLTFRVSASDGAGLIGEGTHERFIIDDEAFLQKTREKH